MIRKVVAIGPESTGKSMLCEGLARHYGTAWCPEYARQYLLKNGMNYSYEDLLTIAKGQLALEDSLVSGEWSMINRELPAKDTHLALPIHHPPPFFVDTDMYVMKVWCEFVFGKCHQFILEQIVERKYDLYLLCNIDLPWIKDELREYPDLVSRQKLYAIYKDILINQSVPWVEISGSDGERVVNAIEAVNKIL